MPTSPAASTRPIPRLVRPPKQPRERKSEPSLSAAPEPVVPPPMQVEHVDPADMEEDTDEWDDETIGKRARTVRGVFGDGRMRERCLLVYEATRWEGWNMRSAYFDHLPEDSAALRAQPVYRLGLCDWQVGW